ncbi:MAG: TetR family transcriptional regulator [Sneathiellaceae bacterium]
MSSDAREKIKDAAQALFAERGLDGVTVRQIVAAAGQKNMAALHYYFGTKEDLVRELIVDAARLMDGRRNDLLDAAEAVGGPAALREVVAIIVDSIVATGGHARARTYMRFVAQIVATRRDLFDSAIGQQWNTGYQRCLAHIRRLSPDLPLPVLNQRLLFLGIYLFNVLAAREGAAAHGPEPHPYWQSPLLLQGLVDSACGLVEAPVGAGLHAGPGPAQPQPAFL